MSRRPARYDVLFEPVRIGPKVMRNRFYQTPHCTRFGSERPGAQAGHRGMKAEGGWAVVMTEYCSVHPESDDGPMVPARLWDDDDVRNLAHMVDAVHAHGALAGVELHYTSLGSTGLTTRLAGRGLLGTSNQAGHASACSSLQRDDIRRVQDYFVRAARRARQAGFDVITIDGQQGASLPSQFLMRLYNRRTDEYGGTLENRARFWLELLERVREEIDGALALTARHCVESHHPDGLGLALAEEGVGFVRLADHLVDFWDVHVGAKRFGISNCDSGSSRFFAENFQGEWIRPLRAATAKPILAVGRFTNPDTMVEVVRSGQQDIIGAARPSIADPFLPRKIEEGRLDEIRECIGCNTCLARVEMASTIVCTQNATVGEEYRRGWHPERFAPVADPEQDVLVVGAGPAGLECAIVLAKRGIRRVHLVDAAREPGGALRYIRRLPGLGEWGRVLDYRTIQVAKLRNLELITSTRLDADAVLDYGADVVVVATGARWADDGMNGLTHLTVPGADASLPHVLTPEQLAVEGKTVPAGAVVIYDCDGYFMGTALAERLLAEGRDVVYMTPFDAVAPYLAYTQEQSYAIDRLVALGARIETGTVATAIDASGVDHAGPYGAERRTDAGAVVLVTERIADDALHAELASRPDDLADAGIRGVYRIGDCRAPRVLADVIFDGHRLAREIDSADPEEALPYLRERRVVDAPREA